VFERLASAVEELEVPVDAAALVEGFALLDRLGAKLSAAVGAFDTAGLWDRDGAVSMTAWLRAAARLSNRRATTVVRMAERLGSLPVTASAYQSGALSEGQVQAVVANLSPRTVEHFAADEAGVVPVLVPLSVQQTADAMTVWRHRAEALLDEAEVPERRRRLHLSPTLGGRHELSGSLDPEGGSVVATALRLARPDDRTATLSARQGEALVDVCRWFLDHQRVAVGGRHRPHLNLVVDLERFEGAVVDGPALDRPSLERLACDATLHRVLTRGRSTILDDGRATRTVPAPLWAALVVRDRHCRFPDCDRPSAWCEGHHVRHWKDGGSTSLDNLALLCSRHHHRCHLPGWSAKLLPDATFEVTGPDGRHLVSRAPP
jgi:hypothetical protein